MLVLPQHLLTYLSLSATKNFSFLPSAMAIARWQWQNGGMTDFHQQHYMCVAIAMHAAIAVHIAMHTAMSIAL